MDEAFIDFTFISPHFVKEQLVIQTASCRLGWDSHVNQTRRHKNGGAVRIEGKRSLRVLRRWDFTLTEIDYQFPKSHELSLMSSGKMNGIWSM
ncbi:hypothetical protein GCK32_018037 [Trichostrongylus colubriformis]|uniref:Uncharacterized protein n=1 Tax=Trichostrongylus colubriformis TaxID=6319 RepID=A0AAN8FPH6_TRICO